MRLLISPVNLDEALTVARAGADIVDLKNTAEGSLGASFPWVLREVAQALAPYDVTISATLGDLPAKPGTAALAAVGAVHSGATYVKAGLYGTKTVAQASAVMTAVRRAAHDLNPDVKIVAAGYADAARIDGLSVDGVVAAASAAQADVVMLDTAIKDGATLFDALSEEALASFIRQGKAAGLSVAVAGSIGFEHLPQLRRLQPDVIGVRSAVCVDGDRRQTVEETRLQQLIDLIRQ